MTFLLSHEILAADGATPTKTLFLLHGIFGSGRNWRTFARRWAEAAPTWRIVAVDLRLHGDSTDSPPPHRIAACAADLEQLAKSVGHPEVVVGHSFGGKVALAYATVATPALEQLFLLDSPPGRPGPDDPKPTATEAGTALGAMRSVATPVASRGEASRTIAAAGLPASIATWLATNLVRGDDGGYRWRFDLDGLEELLRDYWRIDGHELIAQLPQETMFHVVRAGRSDRWSPTELARLDRYAEEGRAEVHLLEDAAHWLHVDDPDGLLQLLLPYFQT